MLVIRHDCVVWYNGAKKKDNDNLKKIIKQQFCLIGRPINLDRVCEVRIVKKIESALADGGHPQNENYVLMTSGKRWLSANAKTTRFLYSFVRSSIRLLNVQGGERGNVSG